MSSPWKGLLPAWPLEGASNVIIASHALPPVNGYHVLLVTQCQLLSPYSRGALSCGKPHAKAIFLPSVEPGFYSTPKGTNKNEASAKADTSFMVPAVGHLGLSAAVNGGWPRNAPAGAISPGGFSSSSPIYKGAVGLPQSGMRSTCQSGGANACPLGVSRISPWVRSPYRRQQRKSRAPVWVPCVLVPAVGLEPT